MGEGSFSRMLGIRIEVLLPCLLVIAADVVRFLSSAPISLVQAAWFRSTAAGTKVKTQGAVTTVTGSSGETLS